MKTRDALKEEYEQKLHELEQEERKTKLLPIPPDSFCGSTWKAPYITYRKTPIGGYPKQEYSLEEALELVRVFEPFVVQVEARKDCCISIQPPALQDASYKNGKLLYDASIFLVVDGGQGYTTTKLQFFSVHEGQHFHVSIEIDRDYRAWSPIIHVREVGYGEYRDKEYTVTPRELRSDNLTTFGRRKDAPVYDFRYSWKTFESFYAWANTQKASTL